MFLKLQIVCSTSVTSKTPGLGRMRFRIAFLDPDTPPTPTLPTFSNWRWWALKAKGTRSTETELAIGQRQGPRGLGYLRCSGRRDTGIPGMLRLLLAVSGLRILL